MGMIHTRFQYAMNFKKKCPEALFKPSLLGKDSSPGIHEAINNCINKCDIDLRIQLYSNIVLSGGSSLFPGFFERLNSELCDLFPNTVSFKLILSPERKYATWNGGSALSSESTFRDTAIYKEVYDAYGPGIVNWKCF